MAPEIQRENLSKVNIDADYKFQARNKIPRQVDFFEKYFKTTIL